VKKFLTNRVTLISEILILILGLIWFLNILISKNEIEIEPIIVMVGSLTFIIISLINIFFINDVDERINIRKDFLYKYIPGEVTIDKIIEHFGQPNSIVSDELKFEYSNDILKLTIYRFKFSNAVVLFTTELNDPNLLSVSLVSKNFDKYPILCRYSFAEDDKLFGKAKITQNILDNLEEFENENYISWCYSAITSRYIEYRPIKYLHLTYFSYNPYKNAQEMSDAIIDGICISTISDLRPIISFDDYIFN